MVHENFLTTECQRGTSFFSVSSLTFPSHELVGAPKQVKPIPTDHCVNAACGIS